MVKKTPRLDAAISWLAQAKKGEVYTYWRGHLERACSNPEALMSNTARRDHLNAVKRAKNKGEPAPKRPDPYKEVRHDARAIFEWAEHQDVRGLVELRCIVLSKAERVYEMTCIVQRNGLRPVQMRERCIAARAQTKRIPPIDLY